MTTSDGSNGPSGAYDPQGPTENMPPPYPPYPAYPPPYPGAAPSQPYAQQPYGPPPMYPAYPGYPPPLPQKNSNRTLWIVLGVIGGVLLLCVICGVVGIVLVQSVIKSPVIGATLAATEFCQDEELQQYDSAYSLFSPTLQSQMTQDEFVSRAQELDTEHGPVTTCTPSTSAAQDSDTSATFTLTVKRGGITPVSTPGTSLTPTATTISSAATTSTGAITLTNSNGSWLIENIDSSLGLN